MSEWVRRPTQAFIHGRRTRDFADEVLDNLERELRLIESNDEPLVVGTWLQCPPVQWYWKQQSGHDPRRGFAVNSASPDHPHLGRSGLKFTRCPMRMAAFPQSSTTARGCPASVLVSRRVVLVHSHLGGTPQSVQDLHGTQGWRRIRHNLKFQEEFSRRIANFLHPVIVLGDSG